MPRDLSASMTKRGESARAGGGDVTEQLSVLPKIHPHDLIGQAREQHRPVASWCMFSGGNDSAVLADVCRNHYEALCFIDTGTAVPGVIEHVQAFAEWLRKPLTIMQAGTAFRDMVLGGQVQKDGTIREPLGFPGPAQHGRAYTRLKERQIEALVRRSKVGHSRRSCVMLLTGKRRAESARRAKTTAGIERRGGQLYVNPLIDWTAYDMREHLAYMRAHGAPQSDAAALLHRSGECCCGAFAEPGEREMLQSLWPDWFEKTIGSLEREAANRGIPHCRWGERPAGATADEAGPMCSSCEWRQEALGMEEAA